MKAEILTKEMREELLNVCSEFLPAKRMQVISNEFDDIVLAPGQDRDYKVSYWDKNNKETHICLGAMSEIDAEDRFNSMFPGNIFISAKEIKI